MKEEVRGAKCEEEDEKEANVFIAELCWSC